MPGDPSTFLIRDDIDDVFQVMEPPTAAEPTIFAPPPLELEAPELIPEIQSETPPPPPAAPTTAVPVATPTPLPPLEPEGILLGELILGPTSGGPGRPCDIIDLTLPLANQSYSPATLRILAFPIDLNGRTRGTLESSVPIGPLRGQITALSYRVPGDATPGEWCLQLFIWDPNTIVPGNPSTYLVQETFEGVFRVR